MTSAPQLTATEPEEVIEATLADYSVYDGPLGSYAVAVSGTGRRWQVDAD